MNEFRLWACAGVLRLITFAVSESAVWGTVSGYSCKFRSLLSVWWCGVHEALKQKRINVVVRLWRYDTNGIYVRKIPRCRSMQVCHTLFPCRLLSGEVAYRIRCAYERCCASASCRKIAKCCNYRGDSRQRCNASDQLPNDKYSFISITVLLTYLIDAGQSIV